MQGYPVLAMMTAISSIEIYGVSTLVDGVQVHLWKKCMIKFDYHDFFQQIRDQYYAGHQE